MGPHPGLGGKPRLPRAGGGGRTALGQAEEAALVLTPAPPCSTACSQTALAPTLWTRVYRRKTEACRAQRALTPTWAYFLSHVTPHTWMSRPGCPTASSSP